MWGNCQDTFSPVFPLKLTFCFVFCHAYNQIKNEFGITYNGIQTLKHIYGAVAPLLDKSAKSHSNNINSKVMKAVGGYEHSTNKIIWSDIDI